MTDLAGHLRAMARYNGWANGQLYAAAERLGTAEWSADCGLFFGSVQGTLNHILVADRIWLRRMTGTGETYDRLDALPFPLLSELKAARAAEDARIVDYVDGLKPDDLAETLHFATTKGVPQTHPLWQALVHFFNHQTHHRGQAHTGLTRLGHQPPSLDLLQFQRLDPVGADGG